MKKLTIFTILSLLLGGLTIPDFAVAEDNAAAMPESREINLTGKLLLVPVAMKEEKDRKGMLSIRVDGGLVHNVEMYLAGIKEDVAWWAYLDMSEYVGKKAVLSFSKPAGRAGVALVESSDQERHLQPLYDEKMRPQFHHSQKQGWNNDPNGMVYYDGEYHLFWQCNPVGNKWGNMYWGHSSSPDMIHWTEHRRALRSFGGEYTPDRHPSMAKKNCFSGSANVDVNNTGGWQTGKEKVMIALFTDTGCGEALAYSNDRGINWTYYDKNPVIKHRGRDPKLIWYEPGKHWVIVAYDESGDKKIGRNLSFYSSTDLKEWTRTSQMSGFYECPELFELPVDSDKNNKRWVLFDASAKYIIGDFDGKKFTPEHEGKHILHHGRFYASQCFSRSPDGRVVQIGWARLGMGKDMPFNQTFTLPINLTLKKTKDGIRMFGNPVKELEKLRKENPIIVKDKQLTGEESSVTFDVKGDLADVILKVKKGISLKEDAVSRAVLRIGKVRADYDFDKQTLSGIPSKLDGDIATMRVLVDRSIHELIGGNGSSYNTRGGGSKGQPIGSVSVTAENCTMTIESLEIYEMKSIWKK